MRLTKDRRLQLASVLADGSGILESIQELQDDLSDIKDDEESAKDGLEAHFSETERYSKMENNVSQLECAEGYIIQAQSNITDAVAAIKHAMQLLGDVD